MPTNFGLSNSLLDAVKKVHDDEVEKQAASAADTEEKNAQFLTDQAERITKYSKQVFGESEELDELSKKSRELAKKKIIPASEEVESEDQIDEKYLGFKKLEGKLAHKGVSNPGAVAASIGMKKYGKKKFEKAAQEHHKMKGMKAEEVDYIEECMKKRILDKVMNLRNKNKE